MRQLAWLHAKPEGSKQSRFKTYQDDTEFHPALRMPDIETEHSAGYLIALLQEAGLMSSYGMGPFPLSWAEIEAWLRCTGLNLTTWERLTIKHLSEDYVNELVQATEKNRPAPYRDENDEIDREAVSNKVLNFFANFFKKP